MCTHENLKPIIEYDENGQKMVYAVVCIDCLQETPISPMTLEEYICDANLKN